jgi:hypothetical protein
LHSSSGGKKGGGLMSSVMEGRKGKKRFSKVRKRINNP